MRQHYPLNSNGAEDAGQLPWADGVPSTGAQGSYPGHAIVTDAEAEILAAIDASGQVRNGSDLTQLVQAIARGVYLGQFSGTANALAAALPNNVVFSSLLRGIRFTGFVTTTNTGGVTVAVTGIGTASGIVQAPLLRKDGTALQAGDLPVSQDFDFRYDGSAFRMIGAVPSDLSKSFNAFFLNRPAQQQLFVDPVNGSENNDGSTSLLARKDIDAVLDQQANVGTALVLLNDAMIKRRRNFYGALSMYGGVASGNGGWNATNRKISFQAVADNSPLSDGTTFCSGLWILGSASFTTNYLGFSLPVQPSGLTLADHIRSDNGGAVLIRGASLNVDGAGAGSLLGNNGGIPLRAIVTIGFGTNAAGHLFLGIAAGGNPNTNPLQYQSNVTSG